MLKRKERWLISALLAIILMAGLLPLNVYADNALVTYTVEYQWTGADNLLNVTLPVDTKQYTSEEEAKRSTAGKKYTDYATAKDAKDNIYCFSGWNTTVDKEFHKVIQTGTWRKGVKPGEWDPDWLPSKYWMVYFNFTCEKNKKHKKRLETAPDSSAYTVAEPYVGTTSIIDNMPAWCYEIRLKNPEQYYLEGHMAGKVNTNKPERVYVTPQSDGAYLVRVRSTGEYYMTCASSVHYSWNGAEQLDHIAQLPNDMNTYEGLAKAQEAIDTTYTKDTTKTGNDGYQYIFSGWDVTTDNATFTVNCEGSWTKGEKDAQAFYTTSYTWSNADNLNVTLPSDSTSYLGVDKAKAAVEKTYISGYKAAGTDGYYYAFSGWDEGTVKDQTVTFSGSWTKTDEKVQSMWYQVEYNWTGANNLNVTLPSDSTSYLGMDKAKAAVEKTYISGYKAAGTDGYYYTFSGWDEGTVKDQTVTFSGSWTKTDDKVSSMWKTVTYTDGVDDEEVFADQMTSVLTGAKTPAFSEPLERKDYIFDGWTPEILGTVTENMTYTAIWKEDKNSNGIADESETYTLTFDPGGGRWSDGTTTVKTINKSIKEKTIVPEAPVKEGYAFVEWRGSSYQPGEIFNETDKAGYVSDDLIAIFKKVEASSAQTGNEKIKPEATGKTKVEKKTTQTKKETAGKAKTKRKTNQTKKTQVNKIQREKTEKTPKTDDTTNIALWMMLAAVSLIAILFIRKQHNI